MSTHRHQHQDRDPQQPLGRRPGRRRAAARPARGSTGRIGNAVKLSGSSEYVALPTGVVSGLTNFTISAWVNPAANTTWSRVFDFGTGTTANMFLTVSAGTAPRFAITTSGSGGEQRLNGTTALPLNTWSHVAVTLSGTTGTLYVNGVAVATNTAHDAAPVEPRQHRRTTGSAARSTPTRTSTRPSTTSRSTTAR